MTGAPGSSPAMSSQPDTGNVGLGGVRVPGDPPGLSNRVVSAPRTRSSTSLSAMRATAMLVTLEFAHAWLMAQPRSSPPARRS
jgi:hypothetical protein